MRLKFIEYIINAACCECRCGVWIARLSWCILRNSKRKTCLSWIIHKNNAYVGHCKQ